MKILSIILSLTFSCHATVVIVKTQFDFLNPGMPSSFALGQDVIQTFTLNSDVVSITNESGMTFTGAITDYRLEIPDAGFRILAGAGDIFVGTNGVTLFSVHSIASDAFEGLVFHQAETFFTMSGDQGSIFDSFEAGSFEYQNFNLYFRDPTTGNQSSGSVFYSYDPPDFSFISLLPAIPESNTALLCGFSLWVLVLRRRRQ